MDTRPRSDSAARERHRSLDFVGLRAHATAVGLIQLCEELLNAGVLSTDGLDRIKEAICSELAVGKRARVADQRDFDAMLRRRVDAIFPAAPGQPARNAIGTAEEFEETMGDYHGA
ncbi:hypothetical protein ATE67_14565 [Sphingopyxis sp. H050]|jgi:hypothetical protein|uniref:hypothetical protein n=1 Tax=Sphingopyxis sp. H050 TaxID=1759072 RepID=UPI000736841D|nr:hypothetical protein [Sphingopyxis sp. H050]KTE19844.1 hypothetical protein ATE67_14565 [Sphingopyxis sp. H050]